MMDIFFDKLAFLWILFVYAVVVGMGLTLGVTSMAILLGAGKKKSTKEGV